MPRFLDFTRNPKPRRRPRPTRPAESRPTPRPRRCVVLYWEPVGDELAWTDGQSGGAGQLDHWLFLDLVHRRQVHDWLVEHHVDLGSSEASGTHALVVDARSGAAWAAPIVLARRIVREQSLAQED